MTVCATGSTTEAKAPSPFTSTPVAEPPYSKTIVVIASPAQTVWVFAGPEVWTIVGWAETSIWVTGEMTSHSSSPGSIKLSSFISLNLVVVSL